MYSSILRMAIFVFILTGNVAFAFAQADDGVVVQFDGSDNLSALGSAVGGFTTNGTDIEIDFLEVTGQAGGLTFDFFSELAFDATENQVSIDFTIGGDNTFSNLDILLLDNDGIETFAPFSELHLYRIPLESLATNVRQNVTLPLVVNGPPFTLGTQPFTSVQIGTQGDSTVNFDAGGGLVGLDIGFANENPGPFAQRAQITVHDVRIEAIPEPAGYLLWSAGSALFFSRRRR